MLDAEISGCRLRETGCRHQASRGLWGLRGRPVRSGKVVPAGRLLEARAKLPETIACRMTLSLRRARHPVCVKGGSCDVIPRSRNAHRCVAAIPFRSANLITCTRTILSAEHPRSAARDQGIIHTARFYRESAALPCSMFSFFSTYMVSRRPPASSLNTQMTVGRSRRKAEWWSSESRSTRSVVMESKEP